MDDDVLYKYNEIWNKIKNTLNIKFHSIPVYDGKYIKPKVKYFNGVIKTNFLGVIRMETKRIIHKFIWKNPNTELKRKICPNS